MVVRVMRPLVIPIQLVGVTLSNSNPSNVGSSANSGSVNFASRRDHVHDISVGYLANNNFTKIFYRRKYLSPIRIVTVIFLVVAAVVVIQVQFLYLYHQVMP